MGKVCAMQPRIAEMRARQCRAREGVAVGQLNAVEQSFSGTIARDDLRSGRIELIAARRHSPNTAFAMMLRWISFEPA